MPRGHPLTKSQKASILALFDEGLNGQQIAAETGAGGTTVYRLINQRDGGRRSVPLIRLVADPSNLFSPHRAKFDMLGIALGVRDQVWAEGTVFEIDGQAARVSGGQLICGRKQLKVEQSGEYKWVEISR